MVTVQFNNRRAFLGLLVLLSVGSNPAWPADNQASFAINRYVIEGNSLLPEDGIQAIV